MDPKKVEQNTEEWKRLRRGPKKIRICGSDAPVACGVDTHKLPHSLYESIIEEFPETDENRKECEHGHRCEPISVRRYEEFTGFHCQTTGFWEHPSEELRDYFGCSPDRLVFLTAAALAAGKPDGLAEVKNKYYQMWTTNKIDPSHLCQMMFQMWITGMPWVDYIVTKIRHEDPENDPCFPIRIWRVYRSEEYINEWMVPRLLFFSRCLQDRVCPPSGLYKTVFPDVGQNNEGDESAWPRWFHSPPAVQHEDLLKWLE